MSFIRSFLLVLVLGVLLTACVAASDKDDARVHCPACDTNFDALYQKRF